jgi:hypothetical protein
MRFLNCIEVAGVNEGDLIGTLPQESARLVTKAAAAGIIVIGLARGGEILTEVFRDWDKKEFGPHEKTLSRSAFIDELKAKGVRYTLELNGDIRIEEQRIVQTAGAVSRTQRPQLARPTSVEELFNAAKDSGAITLTKDVNGIETTYVKGADGKAYWKDVSGYGVARDQDGILNALAAEEEAVNPLANINNAGNVSAAATREVAEDVQSIPGNDIGVVMNTAAAVNPNQAGSVEDNQ